MKIKVGITGQNGFLGSHLFNFFRNKADIERISTDHKLFLNRDLLKKTVKECDYIVHFAGMSRHEDGEFLYNKNMELLNQLISAMEEVKATPHILFSSTTHRDKDTCYHASKRDGQKLLEEWSDRSNGSVTTLVMPNVFGPYCRPYFNSFVATFCDRVANNKKCEIISDSEVQLIYVSELCRLIYSFIKSVCNDREFFPEYSLSIRVSEALSLLLEFKENIKNNTIPTFKSQSELQLFNTLMSYF